MKYRKGYKYQLAEPEFFKTPIIPSEPIETEYIDLGTDGSLFIERGYAWDGSSGPAWDSKTSMRASLAHDAIYQLLRMELLHAEHREQSDKLYRDICIEDRMLKFRAKYHYLAVRRFAESASEAKSSKEILIAP